ncbi:sulfate transporter [Echria macrotheca]|uniref:Sulfate transporter n=1 Tax=Echria macrotheca TaxID=438768 RepID=A0AAJ0BEZ0_9PEZI|nr:sulfate transporter [Echria macrotheca]
MTQLTIAAVNRRNLETLRRSPAAEISGALGDLGTFIPLTLALALRGSIDLRATLVTSGVFNIVTGGIFGVPLPVQPMKAIVAASLAKPNLPDGAPQAAGFLVGAALLFLSATGLIRALASRVPVPVVRGIQLGTGVMLFMSSTPLLIQSRLVSLFAALPLLLTFSFRQFPYALVVFLVGAAIGVVTLYRSQGGRDDHHDSVIPGWSSPGSFLGWFPFGDDARDLLEEALEMATAQLPLTLLNSVVAVTALSADLFPDVPPPTTTALGLSVAAMNLLGAWVGAMPVCHGAGGMAGQFRFGARSGASVMMLGVVKVLSGLVFGDVLVRFLGVFPEGILGVMLVVAAVELCRAGLQGLGEEGLEVALMTAAGMVAMRNAAVGFVVGMVWERVGRARDGGEEGRPLLA